MRNVQHGPVYRTRAERVPVRSEWTGWMKDRLPQFREAVDDPKPYLIADLHLDHFGCEAGAHALGVFQFKLDLSPAPFNEMKQQHRGQTLQFFIRRVLAHVEDLRHAGRPFSKLTRNVSLSLNWRVATMPRKMGCAKGRKSLKSSEAYATLTG